MPEAEQTVNGDYEVLTYHVFSGVDYNRLMSWTAGDGTIGIGVKEVATQKTNTETLRLRLPAGWSVVVSNTNFRLERST